MYYAYFKDAVETMKTRLSYVEAVRAAYQVRTTESFVA
jgi:hypothetical protein